MLAPARLGVVHGLDAILAVVVLRRQPVNMSVIAFGVVLLPDGTQRGPRGCRFAGYRVR
jgi:hypothetical protein